jgi:membrane associated rhomboid family serine protease
MRLRHRPLPVATILITAVTGIVAGAGFLDPAIRDALRRSPDALAAGEWWRLATPLLVRTDGWLVLAIMLAGTAAAGTVVEPRLGWPRLLVLYLAGGLAGQAAGYAWDPTGAGSSVAMLGLFAGVWGLLLRRPGVLPAFPRLAGIVGLCVVTALVGGALISGPAAAAAAAGAGAVTGALAFNRLPRAGGRTTDRVIGVAALASGLALTALRDNHGPAVLASAAAFALLAPRPHVE